MIIQYADRWHCTECKTEYSEGLGNKVIPEKCECETLNDYYLDFTGTIHVQAKTYEDAVKLVGSDNPERVCNRVNDLILEAVNFTF